ncbi:MAG: protein kinase [Desulfobacterales bacterium]|jgi:tetratricopeptide (TPR) repeat protein
MTDFEPKKFGKYQLLDKIAVGGMAELYRAKVTREYGFEKQVAIKKILPHLSDEGNLVKAFIDEAKLAALLQHENIVQIYDFGNLNGEYFIAMEYLFGKDLRKLTYKAKEKAAPIDLESTLYVISRVCAGLDYSHNLKDLKGKPLNIIHRDINPQNIFITYEGQVKIIDFGIAKAASHNSTTHEGLIKGKLAYMSPEQANGKTIDRRSDIFSTGIILYELLAGQRMFQGEVMQIYSRVRDAVYKPLESLVPDLPARLHEVVQHALAKEPDERYQSCGEMLADLEECIYALSFRPNARHFANCVKDLFKQEFAAEENALFAKTEIYGDVPAGFADDPIQDEATGNETIALDVPKISVEFQHNIWRFGLVAAMVIIGFVFDLSLTKLPFTPSDRSVSAYSIELPAPHTNPTEDKIKAAKTALQNKAYSAAVALLEEVLASDPSPGKKILTAYLEALLGLATHMMLKDPDVAKAYLLKALEVDPASISVLSQLGYIYVRHNDYPQAIETYQKVAELDPGRADILFNLGYIYAVTENYSKAKEMYFRVVELAPDFLDEALFNLAMVQAQLGERDKCIKSLEQAIKVNPANASALAYLKQLKQ